MAHICEIKSYLDRIQQTAHALNSVLGESRVIQISLEQTIAALGARGAVARLLSPEGDELVPAWASGLNDSLLMYARR